MLRFHLFVMYLQNLTITTLQKAPFLYQHVIGHNFRMAQGTQCLHAIRNYMRKVKLKYQHVIGIITHYYSNLKSSRDNKSS